MNKIARIAGNERVELFAETAARKGIANAIVEKDFWVCWMLQQLFSIDTLSGRLLFKGGTSLSKVFHAINRFSEDIDLAVDYAALGFTGSHAGTSRNSTVRFLNFSSWHGRSISRKEACRLLGIISTPVVELGGAGVPVTCCLLHVFELLMENTG